MFKKDKSAWVIMPCYNEKKHISKVIDNTLNYSTNLVVVDDGSTDSTFSIVSAKTSKLNPVSGACLYVLRHPVNLGKGAALKTGVEFALERNAKKIIFIDSDDQHEPCEIPKFTSLLDKYDIVFGSRKLNNKMPPLLRLGNYFLTQFARFLFGVTLIDTQSGYRAFSSSIYDTIRWRSTGYDIETEIISYVGRNKLKYKEIEISTIYKDRYKGTTVIDGIKIALKMILYKFQR
jgi:polyprenyl-phospho-N-acetylgalactosaminyl synthase